MTQDAQSAKRGCPGIETLGPLAGRRVLVRCDLNVPTKDGKVTDATRLEANARTLRALAEAGARVGVLAHFGRPKGRDESKSLRIVVPALAELLGRPVAFAEDCIGDAAEAAMAACPDGGVVVLENTRFHAGEEKNDPAFVAALAKLGDAYVNDAFSCAHRAHASTEGLAHHLPSAAGVAMKAEIDALEAALGAPQHPVVAVVGGAKVSSKLDVIGNLVGKVDTLVIAGGMANTFLFANGLAIGKSLAERDLADTARDIVARAAAQGTRVLLPVDAVVAREFAAGAANEVVAVDAVPDDAMVLDVGPASIAAFEALLTDAKTVVWNGPFGAFELQPFDRGTVAAAKAVAQQTQAGQVLSVAGGGDTAAALNHAGVSADFSFVSTAGGAFLEWLEGKVLPGVDAIMP